jgi:hypothetical protein
VRSVMSSRRVIDRPFALNTSITCRAAFPNVVDWSAILIDLWEAPGWLMSELGHVWTAPGWQGLSSRLQAWVSAAMCSACRLPPRGSGPGQKPAFDNAMALVGCPDRRIDRLCIRCCSPSQPSHHAGCPARSRLRRKRDGLFVTLALGHHGPGHARNLASKCNGGDLRPAPCQQRREPGPMPGSVNLGVTDDGECTGHEQAAQIAVTLFADAAEPVLAAT